MNRTGVSSQNYFRYQVLENNPILKDCENGFYFEI